VFRLSRMTDYAVVVLSQMARSDHVVFAAPDLADATGLPLPSVSKVLRLLALGRLDRTRWYLRLCQFTSCLGFVAVIAGWTTTEVGRQPWTVYGLMRTADSVTPSLTGSDVLISLLMYVVVYLVVYPVGLWLMLRLVWRGPVPSDDASPIEAGRPKSPIEALASVTPEGAA